MDHEVLEALKMFRSSTTSSESKPNAKRILKALTLTNPEWKLTHQRMVKILKKEGKPPAKENTCQDANTNKGKATVFSPNTLKKVKAADAPVDPKNVLKTRLRPKSSLSFVYGGARKAKTPTRGETAENEEESETSDPTFVANFEEDEVDSRGPSWVRANQHPAPPLPSPAPVSLKTKAPVAVKLPSPVAATPPPANLPKTKSSSGGFKFNFSGSKSEKTSTTPPRNEVRTRDLRSEELGKHILVTRANCVDTSVSHLCFQLITTASHVTRNACRSCSPLPPPLPTPPPSLPLHLRRTLQAPSS